MSACGFEASPAGVAKCYAGFLDKFVIAQEDCRDAERIEDLGVKVACTDIRMNSLADKKRLAGEVLALVQK